MRKMKNIIYLLMSLILISSVFAVSRPSVSTGGTITYSKENIPLSILKGYWAVEDIVSGCTFSSVSCGTSSYYACSKVGSTIRVVAHSDDSGQNLPSSVTVNVVGSGTCVLSMYHVESWKTSTATVTGSATGPIAGSLSFGGGCVTIEQLSTYITQYKQGSVTIEQLSGYITSYKSC